jgi:mannose-1-phosphate guanylyltransferase
MNTTNYAVIMAGGVGSRFWPQSREAFPKQFLSLYGNRTLIQQTVDRISKVIPYENILIITNQKYIPLVQEQLPELPLNNILGEPMAKNTAPCVALAAQVIGQRNPNSIMCVLPADHVILDESTFLSIMESAFLTAKQKDAIVTVGIEPTHPETGYGYIHFNSNVKTADKANLVHPVFGFKEKPNKETAEEFVQSGDYLWNSGMFIWSVETINDAFLKYQPEMYSLAKSELKNDSGSPTLEQLVSFFSACKSVSVDYAIMENAEKVFVVPGSFGWNDVGSWSAVYDIAEKNSEGNVIQSSNAIVVGSKNSYISSKNGKLIALVGMEDTAVIETEDAILVCNLNASQDVKKVVEQLTENRKIYK